MNINFNEHKLQNLHQKAQNEFSATYEKIVTFYYTHKSIEMKVTI